MKHYLTALALSLCIAGPAFADVQYDVNDVRDELAVHAYNYADDIGKDASGFSFSNAVRAESGCFGAIALGHRLGMTASTEMRHRDFAKVRGARRDEERNEWVITFEQGEQFCTSLGREIVTSAALGHFAELLAMPDVATHGAAVTLASYLAAMTDRDRADDLAKTCEQDVELLQSSKADKQRTINAGGTSISIANANQTVCSRFHSSAAERAAAVQAYDLKSKAEETARKKAAEEAETKAEAAWLVKWTKLGASGDRLNLISEYADTLWGAGRRELSDAQLAKAPMLFHVTEDDLIIHVRKLGFKGNKLVSDTTKTYSRLQYGWEDTRLYH